MEQEKELNKDVKEEANKNILSLLKVDALKRGSHALNLMLRTDDIIVALNGEIYKGNTKSLNQNLKIEDLKVLTIYRKETFFNIKALGPLGINLVELGIDESDEIIKKADEYLKDFNNIDNYHEYEVYKGKNHYYDVIEVNDSSLLASLLPFVWFFHHKLFGPLLLLSATFILLGSIAWWLCLASWVITTIYMSKGSMSLLRGYCLFNEMRPFMKVFSSSSQKVQETIRKMDKKSTYRFPLIGPPIKEEESEKEDKSNSTLHAQEA